MPTEFEIDAAAASLFGMGWDTKTHRAIARRALEAAERIRVVMESTTAPEGITICGDNSHSHT